ncbi:hypothetical protein SKAU_G00335070 [Synaphobranchus kaupii]|uniref:Uncharacterized protein n=1 Tax=Synaphobranchus kaupii TaxID=118154 RepID=A0A9Q1ELU7_SYNKA|nr:hypothetical protein SKAU_G00335070 [Synaphobranchus kaupii]
MSNRSDEPARPESPACHKAFSSRGPLSVHLSGHPPVTPSAGQWLRSQHRGGPFLGQAVTEMRSDTAPSSAGGLHQFTGAGPGINLDMN